MPSDSRVQPSTVPSKVVKATPEFFKQLFKNGKLGTMVPAVLRYNDEGQPSLTF